jgi:hypothetical protein
MLDIEKDAVEIIRRGNVYAAITETEGKNKYFYSVRTYRKFADKDGQEKPAFALDVDRDAKDGQQLLHDAFNWVEQNRKTVTQPEADEPVVIVESEAAA